VCTDVMGRGVDIPDISWVIQYDPPTNARFTATSYSSTIFTSVCLRCFISQAAWHCQHCVNNNSSFQWKRANFDR